jgi:hypothetical protein
MRKNSLILQLGRRTACCIQASKFCSLCINDTFLVGG